MVMCFQDLGMRVNCMWLILPRHFLYVTSIHGLVVTVLGSGTAWPPLLDFMCPLPSVSPRPELLVPILCAVLADVLRIHRFTSAAAFTLAAERGGSVRYAVAL